MRLSWLALLLCAASRDAGAQTGAQPTLVFDLFAGVITGHPLWRIARQPICQPNFNGQCGGSPTYDTLALIRTVSTGLMGGISATIFPTPTIGVQLEMAYLGLNMANHCTPVAVASPANQQVCSDLQGTSIPANTLALYGGLIARAASRKAISPYVRAGVGLTATSRSTIAMATVSKVIVFDTHAGGLAPSAQAGVGITSSLGPGYLFRLEIRDVVAKQDRMDGPANSLGQGPASSKFYHHIGLTMGVDVVLDRKRGRRY